MGGVITVVGIGTIGAAGGGGVDTAAGIAMTGAGIAVIVIGTIEVGAIAAKSSLGQITQDCAACAVLFFCGRTHLNQACLSAFLTRPPPLSNSSAALPTRRHKLPLAGRHSPRLLRNPRILTTSQFCKRCVENASVPPAKM